MSEVNLIINGRGYDISCDDGQEDRVQTLGKHIDERLKEISRAGAATNENHLLVLTSLVMADELFTLREQVANMGDEAKDVSSLKEEEAAIAGAIDTLADRIDSIADRIQSA